MNKKLAIQQLARESYDKAINLLENIFDLTRMALKSEGHNYNTRVALNQFDVLLQYSMMEAALYDNNLHIEELKFISSLARYYDFCDYLNQHGYHDVTWQTIWNTDEFELNRVISKYENDMIDLSEEFIMIFSAADIAIKDIDLTSELIKLVLSILAGVSIADGDLDSDEIAGCLIISILQKIIDKKSSADNTSKSNSSTKKKALKDFYIKKN